MNTKNLRAAAHAALLVARSAAADIGTQTDRLHVEFCIAVAAGYRWLRDARYNRRAAKFHPGFADLDPDDGAAMLHYSATSKRMVPCSGRRCDFCSYTGQLQHRNLDGGSGATAA